MLALAPGAETKPEALRQLQRIIGQEQHWVLLLRSVDLLFQIGQKTRTADIRHSILNGDSEENLGGLLQLKNFAQNHHFVSRKTQLRATWISVAADQAMRNIENQTSTEDTYIELDVPQQHTMTRQQSSESNIMFDANGSLVHFDKTTQRVRRFSGAFSTFGKESSIDNKEYVTFDIPSKIRVTDSSTDHPVRDEGTSEPIYESLPTEPTAVTQLVEMASNLWEEET